MSDKELLQSIKKGELIAVETLVDRYKSIVNALARPYFLVGGDYEDLVQEGMIGLYKAVITYDDKSSTSFVTYAYACIKNKILDAIKSANRNKHQALNEYISISSFVNTNSFVVNSPEEITIEKERQQFVEKEIKQTLNDQEYKVFLAYIQGMSYTKIAQETQLDTKKVDNLLQKIKRKIKKINFEKF